MDLVNAAVVAAGMIVAGSINAIAGGGTVFSFTALVWAGLPLINANATNATALVPGSIGGVFALRRELAAQRRNFLLLLAPTLTGSLTGAFVVSNSAESIFRAIVPWLVLFATAVFASRNFLVRLLLKQAVRHPGEPRITRAGWVTGIVLQFLIALYGGYFGAGIGILMLTSLSIMGFHDVVRMNALKNALAIGINGTAALFFIFAGRVVWQYALLGAVFSMIGGYVLARLARRIDQDVLRAAVIAAGIVVSAWMFWRLSA